MTMARMNGLGLGTTTRRGRYCFQTPRDGNDDDDDRWRRVPLPDLSATTLTKTWT